MKKIISILSSVLLLAVTHQGAAHEDEYLLSLSLGELLGTKVSTVSRTSERLDDSPGSVYVITHETIKRRGYTSLKDVLQVIPGVNVFHKDLQYVGMFRGLSANDNEKFTLLINGQEMNGIYEPEFMNGPINLDTVERIEIVVGPSSIFRPANTLVATINVITKQSDTAEVVTSVGSERKYAFSGSWGKTWEEEVKIHVSGSIEERNGFDAWGQDFSVDPLRANAGSKVTGKSAQPDHFLVVNGQYHDWSVQLTSSHKDFYELRLPPGEPEPHYIDLMRGIEIKHQHQVNKNLSTLLSLSSVYKSMGRYSSDAAWLSLTQMDWNAEAGLTYTGFKGHTLQTGIQLIYEDNMEAIFQDVGAPTQQTFYDKDTSGIGFYIDDQYKVNDKLELVAGLRVDHNTLVEKQAYPSGRAAVIYHATDHWTSKVMLNKSTRMPSPLAALNQIWGLDAPSPPVWAGSSPIADKPEELVTLEWGNIVYFEKTRVALNLYYQQLDNFITWGSPHSNVGDYDGWGIELSLNQEVTKDISFWGNVSYINSTFETSESFDLAANNTDAHQAIDDSGRLIGAPQLTINAGIDSRLSDHILFSTQVRYFTMQPTETTNDGGATFAFEETSDQFYVDASLLFEDVFRKGLDIRVSAKNLLDNRDPVGGPWLRGSYSPRGASLEISTYIEF
ncbi:MAG: TonB-dependent receptor plug domain-containing protein [Opitutaceae bacterium]